MWNDPAKVYALVDPRLNEIRYVGLTCQDLEKRLRQHWVGRRQEGNPYKRAWLLELDREGLMPSVRPLPTGLVSRGEAGWWERNYIHNLLAVGNLLVNKAEVEDPRDRLNLDTARRYIEARSPRRLESWQWWALWENLLDSHWPRLQPHTWAYLVHEVHGVKLPIYGVMLEDWPWVRDEVVRVPVQYDERRREWQEAEA